VAKWGEGDPVVPTTLLSPSPSFKELKMKMNWEVCKRPTTCRGCYKIMPKGETRLRTIQPGYRFKEIKYYCQTCGLLQERGWGIKDELLKYDESKRYIVVKRLKRRFLRPVEVEE